MELDCEPAAGLALCSPQSAAVARLCGRRRDYPDHRHRRQHGHIQHYRYHPAAAAAVSRSRPTGSAIRNRSGARQYPFAGPDFLDWRAQNKTFQDMALFGWSGDMNLSGEGRPDHVLAVPTQANFFALLGVQPILGRTWLPGEDQPGKDQVAVLSYGLWREHFAGDPGAVGRTIALNSKKYTIVGVMPASFRYPFQTQMWIPLDMDFKSWMGQRGSHWANAIGRLKPGVSLETARADLKLISGRLEKTYPDSNDKVGSAAVALHDDLVGDSRASLLMMLSAVGLVLLIACANVANLLLSRAVARQKEMAVRSALGAARGRLLRQLLTESLLLSLFGGALGLLVAWVLIALVSRAKNLALPQFAVIQLNGEVLAFTFRAVRGDRRVVRPGSGAAHVAPRSARGVERRRGQFDQPRQAAPVHQQRAGGGRNGAVDAAAGFSRAAAERLRAPAKSGYRRAAGRRVHGGGASARTQYKTGRRSWSFRSRCWRNARTSPAWTQPP
jgi:hypothetical protein